MRPKKMVASFTVVGLMAVLFCIPIVYSLSASMSGSGTLSTGSAAPAATSMASAGTFLLVIVGGVGGLWLSVSKGLTYLGDGRKASGPRGALGLRQASVDNAIPAGLPLRSAVEYQSGQEEPHPANHRQAQELNVAKVAKARGERATRNARPKGSKRTASHVKAHAVKISARGLARSR